MVDATPRKIYFQTWSIFRWTEPAGPFYRGESFSIRVQLDRPVDKTQVVANIVRDQGPDQKIYPVHVQGGQSVADVTVAIEDDYKKDSEAAKTKINFRLQRGVDGIELGNDVEIDVDLDPHPALSFEGDQPGLEKFKADGKYSLSLRQKVAVRVYLSGRPHRRGSSAEVSSDAIAKTVPVRFTDSKFVDVPIRVDKAGDWELKLNQKSRSSLSDSYKPLSLSVSATPTVAFVSEDDWIDPPSPVVRDLVKFRLALTGAAPPQKARILLTSYCFTSNPEISIEPDAWDSDVAEVGPFLLAKSPSLFDPTVELTVLDSAVKAGLVTKKKFSLGAKRTVYFSSYALSQYTDLKTPLYRGETFKVRVEVDKEVDKTGTVAKIVWDDPAGKAEPVSIEASKKTAEIPLTIEEDFKDDSKDKTTKFHLKLQAEEGFAVLSGVKSAGPGKDTGLNLDLAPPPAAGFADIASTVRFGDGQPGLKAFKKDTAYLFPSYTKVKVRIYLNTRPHEKGSSVKLSYSALPDPVPISFAAAGFVDQEIEITKPGELKLTDASGCVLDPKLQPLQVLVEPFYFAEPDWIEGKGKGVFVRGDTVEIQVSRLDDSDGPGEFGSLTCDAFEKPYPVVFESKKTISKTIQARIKDDLKVSDTPTAFDIKIVPTTNQISTARQTIKVAKRRLIHIPPGQFDKDARFAPGQSVKVRVNLSVAATRDTRFAVASPAFGGHKYEGEIKAWSRTTTVRVEFARVFAKEQGYIEVSEVQANPDTPSNVTIDHGSDDFSPALKVTVRDPRVAFKAGQPFSSKPETEKDIDAVFGVGSKVTVNLELDRPALIPARAVVICDALANFYPVTFEKESRTAQVEVEFKRGFEQPVSLRVSGAAHCRASQEKDKPSSQLTVRVKPVPAVRFREPGWINPAEKIFAAGDTAKVSVCLTHPAPPEGAVAKLKSSAFSEEYTIKFDPGSTESKPAETPIKFSNAKDGQYQTIVLESAAGCTTATEFLRLVQVYSQRSVYFERAPLLPLGPYRKDKKAEIYVRLQPQAITEAAVTVKGPFDDAAVKFGAGQSQQKVAVVFTKESDKDVEIELANPSGCALGTGIKHGLKVYTPVADFDEPAVEEKEPAAPGEFVRVRLRLDSPAPVDGCSLDLTSEAFEEGKKYKVTFPQGEATAAIPVRIRHDYKVKEQAKPAIKISGFDGCTGGSKTAADVEIASPPTIRFDKSQMSAIDNGEFTSEDEIKLFIAASAAPANDLDIEMRSSAFATGRVYVATIPANQWTPVEVSAVLTNGKADNGLAVAQRIEVRPPAGWLADPLDGVINVKVKPKNGTTTETCPYAKAAAQKAAEPPAADDAAEKHKPAVNVKDDTCNLHRLLITVKHGNQKEKKEGEAAEDRGPKKDGTFEVVLHKDAAKDRSSALVCTSSEIPIIQVIAGHEFGDPYVPSPDETVHHTVVQVSLDAADHYCDQQFMHPDAGALQHPIIRVRDRVKGALSELEGRIVKAAEAAQEKADKAANPAEAFGGNVSEATSKVKEKLDQKLSWVSTLTEKVSAFQQKGLKKVGDSLGLEVDADDAAAPPPKASAKRPWRQRYDWLPTRPLDSLRPAIPAEADKPLLEFPVYQAYQIWHEEAAPDQTDDSPTGKIASVIPVTVSAGADRDQTKDAVRGLGRVRDVMSALSFMKMAPRQYEIVVHSCGVPATEPADSFVTPTLRAIVEVYPSDEFCLHYSFQPKNYEPVCIGIQAPAAPAASSASASSTSSGSESSSDSDDDWSLEVDIDMPEQEGKGLLPDSPPPWPPDGIYRGNFINPASVEPPKWQRGQPKEVKGLVFHPYKKDDSGDSDPLWKKVVAALQQENAFTLPQQETIVEGRIDLDSLSGSKLSDTQQALDDKLFGPVNDSGIVLTRNGKSGNFYFEIVKSLSASVQTIRQIVAAFEGISANFTQVAGWGFQFEIRFMEGEANVYWGWKEYKDQRVFPWYSVHLDLMLAKISVAFNAGYTASVYLMKFQAVVYFKVSLEASINDQFFERQSPDDKLPAWADTWVSFMGKAESGANLVLVSENVFHVNAAIKTGLEMRTRITMGIDVQFGIEYQLYWLGVTAGATFKIAGFKEKQATITLVEGSPKDLPYRRGMFPKPANATWWNVRRELNMAYSRAVYQEERISEGIEAYRKLQLEMIGPGAKTTEPPLLAPDDDAGKRKWDENKTKWDEQWKDCRATFGAESRTVKTRTLKRTFTLEKRLDEKVNEAEKALGELLDLADGLKGVKKKILDFTNEVYVAEVSADQGQPAPDWMLQDAIKLGREKDLHYSESIRHQPLQDLKDLVEDLRYYAAFREAVK